MTPSETLLQDHQSRKDAEGVTWFTAADLARLGLREPLMTTMQNLQHALKLRRASAVVECGGRVDAFSLRDA